MQHSSGQNVEVAVAGGGTEVLDDEAERTDVFEGGLLGPREAERGGLAVDPGVTEGAGPHTPPVPRELPEPRMERTLPGSATGVVPKARNSPPWTSRLAMFLVAVFALAGLAGLSLAIARELAAANSSDDLADIGYSYSCDKVSGSDPGVYGVGHCQASKGLQASGIIPVGQAYVLTPRSANALGYTQSYACSGGRADSPTMVVPKRCAAIGNPVLASR